MLESIRIFFWQHRQFLAITYLGGLAIIMLGMTWYIYYSPASLNVAATIAIRNFAYERSFQAVRNAKIDIDNGRQRDAELRLSRFLSENEGIQRSQLNTNAVLEAVELLSTIYIKQGKSNKALQLLGHIIEITPLNYRVWYLRAQFFNNRGALKEAQTDFHKAFLLAPDNPKLTNDYLKVLADLPDYKQILWVENQFNRSYRRGMPIARLKIGTARSTFQRKLLDAVGIPVEHGSFILSKDYAGLPRGKQKTLHVPVEMISHLQSVSGELYFQLRIEGVYEQFKIHSFRFRLNDGNWQEQVATSDNTRYFHRAHSGAEFYAEIHTGETAINISEVDIVYSCPIPKLSLEAENAIERARRNLFIAEQNI